MLVHVGIDANWTAEARIREVSITRDVFSSSAFLTFCAAVCFLLLDSAVYLFGREQQNRGTIRQYLKDHALLWIIGGVILGILCWPLHKEELLRGHDLYYHLFRIYAIAAGWRNGMFPVRIEPAWYNGFGSASGVMYGSLLLWPAAFLYLVGVPLKTAYRLYMIGINLGTLLISYFSFLRISNSRRAATLGMTVYSLMIYRMTDLYTRAAVGEYTAMMFLPLLAAGISMLFYQSDCEGNKREGRTAIVIGLSGLIQTHVLTLFIMGQVFLVYGLLNLRRTFRVKNILEILKAVLLTLGLNLWFLVPFLDYYTTQNFKVLHERYSLEEYTIRPQQIFSWRYLPAGSFNEDPSVCMPLSLGVVSLFIILLSVAAILMSRQRDDRILVNGMPEEIDELKILNISRRENDFTISCKQPLQSDEMIIFPLVYYKGYCVWYFTETGELLRTVKPQNTDGCVTVNLQRGFTGSTWIFFREPWYWRMAEIFSLGLAGILIVWRNRLVVVHSILM